MYTLFLCSCINRIILLKGKKYYIEMCENDFHKCKWFCALYYMSHCFLVNTKVTTPSTKMNFTNPEHYYWTTTMFNVKISVQKKSRLLNFPIIHNLYNWVCKHIIVINIKSQRASPSPFFLHKICAHWCYLYMKETKVHTYSLPIKFCKHNYRATLYGSEQLNNWICADKENES